VSKDIDNGWRRKYISILGSDGGKGFLGRLNLGIYVAWRRNV